MAHIRQATWPLVLRFRLPLEERDVFSLAKIADMRYLILKCADYIIFLLIFIVFVAPPMYCARSSFSLPPPI